MYTGMVNRMDSVMVPLAPHRVVMSASRTSLRRRCGSSVRLRTCTRSMHITHTKRMSSSSAVSATM